MNHLHAWAAHHHISPVALADLQQMLGTVQTDPSPQAGESEAAVQNRIRLEASRKGCRLWRNNVGAFEDEDGRFIRYGLCNESHSMNQIIKSSDLVGIRPVLIESYHVGGVIGQFVAREVKAGDWKYAATEREVAQLKFLELVTSMGGDAMFANQEGTL